MAEGDGETTETAEAVFVIGCILGGCLISGFAFVGDIDVGSMRIVGEGGKPDPPSLP